MRLKYLMCFIIIGCFLYVSSEKCFCEELEDEKGEYVIKEMVEAIQEKRWTDFTELMCASEQEFYNNYFADLDAGNGIKQIENAVIVDLWDVNLDIVKNEILEDEYPILKSTSEKQAYILGLDCEVNRETKYFFNGINYFLIILARDDKGDLKIVQFNRPSMDVLNEISSYNITANDKLYKEKMNGISVIEEAENGRIINADGEVIKCDFEIIDAYIIPFTEEGISVAASGTTDFPNLGEYTNYSYPITISVKMNKTGNNEIVKVDFNTYIKNTLPNEWYSSWNPESLKAGAYCVKMVGWYRTIRPVSSAGGYDVSQGTQKYVPNSSAYTTDNAVDSISGSGIANSDNQIFFPEYAAGTKGEPGTMHGGQLKQWGSQFLAEEWGYTYVGILNYYYMKSNYSSSYIKYFTY